MGLAERAASAGGDRLSIGVRPSWSIIISDQSGHRGQHLVNRLVNLGWKFVICVGGRQWTSNGAEA